MENSKRDMNEKNLPLDVDHAAEQAIAKFERLVNAPPANKGNVNPWLVLGGAVLAGVLVNSLLKSSKGAHFQPAIAGTTHDIGSTIRNRRKNLGLTQAQLAKQAGVGPRFISDVERGKETAEMNKVLMVLDSLDLQIKLTRRG